MANKNIAKDGKKTRFTSENQPLNRGRKPKLYTIAKKAYNISYDEWKEVVVYVMQCTKKEVEDIIEKDDTPMWVINICRALYKDSGKGSIATLKELTEKLWGKPMQETKPEDADIPTNIDHGISIDSWIKKQVK